MFCLVCEHNCSVSSVEDNDAEMINMTFLHGAEFTLKMWISGEGMLAMELSSVRMPRAISH